MAARRAATQSGNNEKSLFANSHSFSATPLARGGWATVVVIAVVTLGWARLVEGYSFHAPSNLPTNALTQVIDKHSDKVVFHHYNWGGWLTWHGWPKVKNWIDDRNEVQGQAHIERYMLAMDAQPGWEKVLDETAVDRALDHAAAIRQSIPNLRATASPLFTPSSWNPKPQ